MEGDGRAEGIVSTEGKGGREGQLSISYASQGSIYGHGFICSILLLRYISSKLLR